MYWRSTPSSLQDLALQSLTNAVRLICLNLIVENNERTASKLEYEIDRLRSNVLQNIPFHIINNFCAVVLEGICKGIEERKYAETRFQKEAIEDVVKAIVCNPRLRTLCFGYSIGSSSHIGYSVLNCFPYLQNIQHLNLHMSYRCKSFNIDSNAENLIVNGLQSMPNILVFKNNFCTDNILLALSSTCNKVTDVDISQSNVTTEGALQLDKCECITKLNFEATSIGYEASAHLMASLKRLRDINFEFFDSTLKFLSDRMEKCRPLKIAVIRNNTHARYLELLNGLCPEVRSIKVNVDYNRDKLCILRKFQKLVNLEIVGCKYYLNGVDDFLKINGCSLHSLRISGAEGIDQNALSCIAEYCPNLKSIDLHHCCSNVAVHTTNNSTHTAVQFSNLLQVKILNSSVDIEFLMSRSINLECVTVVGVREMTDACISRILHVNCMSNMKSFTLILYKNEYYVGMTSVYKLLDSCASLEKLCVNVKSSEKNKVEELLKYLEKKASKVCLFIPNFRDENFDSDNWLSD